MKGNPKEYNKLSVNPILCPLETDVIYCGDCLEQKIPGESIDLIYIASPFSSNGNYVVSARARAGQTDELRVCVRQIG